MKFNFKLSTHYLCHSECNEESITQTWLYPFRAGFG